MVKSHFEKMFMDYIPLQILLDNVCKRIYKNIISMLDWKQVL